MDWEMRVWWIPQVPGKPFYVKVKDFNQAVFVLNTLADYDVFQYENNIKGDYSNAGGLEELDDEWVEWHSEDDDDINEWMQLNL